jgi:hypothetical protein
MFFDCSADLNYDQIMLFSEANKCIILPNMLNIAIVQESAIWYIVGAYRVYSIDSPALTGYIQLSPSLPFYISPCPGGQLSRVFHKSR